MDSSISLVDDDLQYYRLTKEMSYIFDSDIFSRRAHFILLEMSGIIDSFIESEL